MSHDLEPGEYCDRCNEAKPFCICKDWIGTDAPKDSFAELMTIPTGLHIPQCEPIAIHQESEPVPTPLIIHRPSSSPPAALAIPAGLDTSKFLDGFARPELYKNDYVSVSRLKLYEQCPRAFFFKYVAKAPKAAPEPNSPSTLGNVVHEALEGMYEWAMREEYVGTMPDEQIITHLQDAWARHDAKRGNLSGVGIYKYCLAALRRYFRGREVDGNAAIGVEIPISETDARITELFGGVPLQGFMDRVERRNGSDVAVVDYKNGFMTFTDDEITNDLQSSIYDVVARTFWPWAKTVHLEFHMIRHNLVQPVKRTDADREAVRHYVPMLTKQTETDSDYPAKINKNCGYCDYRNHCSLYKKLTEEHDDRVHINKDNKEEILLRYKRTTDIAKAAKQRAKTLEEVVNAYLLEQPEQTTKAGDYTFTLSHWENHEYLVGDTVKAMRESGVSKEKIYDVLKVDPWEMETMLKTIPDRDRRALLEIEMKSVAVNTKKPRIQISGKKKT